MKDALSSSFPPVAASVVVNYCLGETLSIPGHSHRGFVPVVEVCTNDSLVSTDHGQKAASLAQFIDQSINDTISQHTLPKMQALSKPPPAQPAYFLPLPLPLAGAAAAGPPALGAFRTAVASSDLRGSETGGLGSGERSPAR